MHLHLIGRRSSVKRLSLEFKLLVTTWLLKVFTRNRKVIRQRFDVGLHCWENSQRDEEYEKYVPHLYPRLNTQSTVGVSRKIKTDLKKNRLYLFHNGDMRLNESHATSSWRRCIRIHRFSLKFFFFNDHSSLLTHITIVTEEQL